VSGLTAYLAWCPALGYEEADECEVQACGSEFAAEEWARNLDDAAYVRGDRREFTSGRACVVDVRDPDGDVTRWTVSAKLVPEYTAKPYTVNETATTA